MSRLAACRSCTRLYRPDDRACPFCGHVHPSTKAALSMVVTSLLVAGCTVPYEGEDPVGGGTSVSTSESTSESTSTSGASSVSAPTPDPSSTTWNDPDSVPGEASYGSPETDDTWWLTESTGCSESTTGSSESTTGSDTEQGESASESTSDGTG